MTAATPVPWTAPDSNLDQSALREAYAASEDSNAAASDGPWKFLAQSTLDDEFYAAANGAVRTFPLDEKGASSYFKPTLYGKTIDE